MGSCFDKHAKCWANSELGQKSGLMYLVVPLTNPEWSIVRIKTERLFTFMKYKDTVMVPESIQLYFL